MDIKIRQKLRAKIPHGELTKIANDNGFSRITIYNWFNGTNSPKVEKAITNYIKNKASEKEEINKTVSEFIAN